MGLIFWKLFIGFFNCVIILVCCMIVLVNMFCNSVVFLVFGGLFIVFRLVLIGFLLWIILIVICCINDWKYFLGLGYCLFGRFFIFNNFEIKFWFWFIFCFVVILGFKFKYFNSNELFVDVCNICLIFLV